MENKKSKKHVDQRKGNASKHESKLHNNRDRKSQRAGESGLLSFLQKTHSDNVSKSRITKEIGLYALGRTSTKIKRDRFNGLNEEQQARAKEDLDTLLQLATKNRSQTTPSITTPVFATPVGSSVKKSQLSKSYEDDDSLVNVVKLAINSSSDSESVPEEKLLEESFDYVTKGFEMELDNLMEDEADKNYAQETKKFLKSVYQQRFARTDPSYMLFSDTTFQSDLSSSSSKSQEKVDAPSEVSSAKVETAFKHVETRSQPHVETHTQPQVAVSSVPVHSEVSFTFSPEIVEMIQPSSLNLDRMCNIYLNNFPTLSSSPSEHMDDRSSAHSPRFTSSHQIVSPFVSPVPRFHPHWLFNK